jgi:hypothetical protein
MKQVVESGVLSGKEMPTNVVCKRKEIHASFFGGEPLLKFPMMKTVVE